MTDQLDLFHTHAETPEERSRRLHRERVARDRAAAEQRGIRQLNIAAVPDHRRDAVRDAARAVIDGRWPTSSAPRKWIAVAALGGAVVGYIIGLLA